jgi:hypothetical protein
MPAERLFPAVELPDGTMRLAWPGGAAGETSKPIAIVPPAQRMREFEQLLKAIKNNTNTIKYYQISVMLEAAKADEAVQQAKNAETKAGAAKNQAMATKNAGKIAAANQKYNKVVLLVGRANAAAAQATAAARLLKGTSVSIATGKAQLEAAKKAYATADKLAQEAIKAAK